jgi:hypothetical protein
MQTVFQIFNGAICRPKEQMTADLSFLPSLDGQTRISPQLPFHYIHYVSIFFEIEQDKCGAIKQQHGSL